MSRGKLAGLLMAVTLLAGGILSSGAGVAAQDSTPEASGSSFPVQITFLNAMTSTDNIDVYINGPDKDQRVAENLAYGTFTDAFEGTSPATEIIVKHNRNNRFDTYLFDTVVPTEAGNNYVVVISDFIIIPMQMNVSPAAADSKVANPARARLINASSQAPALDVVVNDQTITTDLGYGQAGDGGVIASGGDYTVTLNQTGTTNVALTQDGISLDANTSYVFVIIGNPGSQDNPLALVSTSLPFASS